MHLDALLAHVGSVVYRIQFCVKPYEQRHDIRHHPVVFFIMCSIVLNLGEAVVLACWICLFRMTILTRNSLIDPAREGLRCCRFHVGSKATDAWHCLDERGGM